MSDQAQSPSHSRTLNVFTAHPASVGETYWQHFFFATKFSLRLFGAAFAALVHAVLPFLFDKTASKIVAKLHARLTNRFDG